MSLLAAVCPGVNVRTAGGVPNVLDDPVQDNRRGSIYRVLTQKPDTVASYVAAHDPHNAAVEEDICYSEESNCAVDSITNEIQGR